ncbi:MAG: YdcF family protein [Verrucomicrobiales bacterium]
MHMLSFGTTDYRRKADAVVVFGARAYANGTPSDALADRVRTACDLYHQGLVRALIMSGGPGDGAIHETEAMRQYAIRLGIPDEAILLDKKGVNTAATIDAAKEISKARHYSSLLAVSHGYHLPRIKMNAQKVGLEVFTVPAHTPRFLAKLPYFMVRETVAWWSYLFRAA